MTVFKPGESGVLLIDKPSGPTSRDAVDRVEERVPDRKVGHGGTLDPLAIGLLPIMIGEATKLVPYLHRQPKTYEVTARLDRTSDTLDRGGSIRELNPDARPTAEDLMQALRRFEGKIEQAPPAYSALKREGVRLYERVRDGEQVDVEPRRVQCYGTAIVSYEYPRLVFTVRCGKGFYVRSLVRDLAETLSLPGAMVQELRRTAYGPYSVRRAAPLEDESGWSDSFFPPVSVLQDWQHVECQGETLRLVTHGNDIPRRVEADWAAAVDAEGRLHAVLKRSRRDDQPRWQPKRVLNRSWN